MAESKPVQVSGKYVTITIVLSVIAILATALIGYFVTSFPRGLIVWSTITLLCVIEFFFCILSINILLTNRSRYKPSGATLAITYGIIFLFGLSDIITIIVYRFLRNFSGTKDTAFIAILIGLMIFWSIIASIIYANDLRTKATFQPVIQKRAEHRQLAQLILPLINTIRSIKAKSDVDRVRLSILIKNLESINTSLSHSHGGGSGSWDSPPLNQIPPNQEKIIQDNIFKISQNLPELSNNDANTYLPPLSEIEQCVTNISSIINNLGLQ
jgi:hypothetical protein